MTIGTDSLHSGPRSVINNLARFNVLPTLSAEQRVLWEEAELALRVRCDDGCRRPVLYGPVMGQTDALRTIIGMVPQAEPEFMEAVSLSTATPPRRIFWREKVTGLFGSSFPQAPRPCCPECVPEDGGRIWDEVGTWRKLPGRKRRAFVPSLPNSVPPRILTPWGGILVVQKTAPDYGDPWMQIRAELNSCPTCDWRYGEVRVTLHPVYKREWAGFDITGRA